MRPNQLKQRPVHAFIAAVGAFLSMSNIHAAEFLVELSANASESTRAALPKDGRYR